MTDNTSLLQDQPTHPKTWRDIVPPWVPVFIGLVTLLGGWAGGYMSTQVTAQVVRAHVDWELQDHERRINTLEKLPDLLNRIDGRLYRIEGALGVKQQPQSP